VRDYPAPTENNLFASSTDLQAGAAAAIRTLAANGNVTATEQLPLGDAADKQVRLLARLRERLLT
jgi:hypothetical protein